LAVDEHRAGAAVAGAAALLGAGELQLVAHHLEQGAVRLGEHLVVTSVHLQREDLLRHP
jgi:hypothetical protein